MVEDVEKIRSRLKGKALPEFELPPQRQIDLRGAESAQGISSQGSLSRRGGYAECCWIDSLSAGYIRIGNRECYSRNEILSLRRTALARFDRFTPMMAVSSLDFSSHLRHKRPHECGRGTQECVRHALIRQPAFEADEKWRLG